MNLGHYCLTDNTGRVHANLISLWGGLRVQFEKELTTQSL